MHDDPRDDALSTENDGRECTYATSDSLQLLLISPELWREVHTALKLHFSTELPFLNDEDFYTRVNQPAAERSADTRIFLLGVLALTARFIPKPSQHDALARSEACAIALAASLDERGLTGQLTLERVQGWIMICLYHWEMDRGPRAYYCITTAAGMVQKMRGLVTDEQTPMDRQTMGRTVLSCFILEQFLAPANSNQPQIFKVDDLVVPCSEEDFQSGLRMDSPDRPDGPGSSRNIESNPMDTYIRLVEMWGRVSRRLCDNRRWEEQYPPSDPLSEVYQLREQLFIISKSLPVKPTQVNTLEHKTINLCLAIHTLYLVCEILIHREYLPSPRPRSNDPPEPKFLPHKYHISSDFREECASIISKSVGDIRDMMRDTSKRGVLANSPQVKFVIWAIAYASIYSKLPNRNDVFTSAIATLEDMGRTSKIAHMWIAALKDLKEGRPRDMRILVARRLGAGAHMGWMSSEGGSKGISQDER
ncbi:hypothetical protein O988_05849 [Pseudogymnoascus sp. VKM F-3808]|nr:hypothetical protein O988_05849 [Pseudogymnoascus sp. VKM F-3808]